MQSFVASLFATFGYSLILRATLRIILLNCQDDFAVKSTTRTRENCRRALRVTCRTCTKKKKRRLSCFVDATKYNILCPHQLHNLIKIGKNSWNAYGSLEGSPWKTLDRWTIVPATPGGVCCSSALIASGCHVLFSLLDRCCALFFSEECFAFPCGCWKIYAQPPFVSRWCCGGKRASFFGEVSMRVGQPWGCVAVWIISSFDASKAIGLIVL